MKNISKLWIVLPSLPMIASCAQEEKSEQPNILFIQCDQLNRMALGCYGGPIETPNIDRLAQNGIRFTDMICATPSSTPSRGSIVTGLYPHESGIYTNINEKHNGVNQNDTTTDKILNERGYLTHHYGKWHLEDGATRAMNLSYFPDPFTFEVQYKEQYQKEFEETKKNDNGDWMEYYGFKFPVKLSDTFKEMQPRLSKLWGKKIFKDLAMKMGMMRMPSYKWHDEITAEKTIERIKSYEYSTSPFAVTCSFIWPHDPNFVHEEFYNSFNPDEMEVSQIKELENYFQKDWSHQMMVEFKNKGAQEFLRIYLGAVKYIDAQIGRIVDTLEKTGKLNNTLIVFTSDHGDMLTSHDMIWKSTNSYYKETVNIPLIMSYPNKIKGNSVCDVQAHVIDFMPTFLEYAGLSEYFPENRSGKSLVPAIEGRVDADSFRKYNFCERIRTLDTDREITPNHVGSFMVQTKEWKYMIFEDGTEYLYNRIQDPDEINDRAKDPSCSNIITELKGQISNWLVETNWKGKKFPFN